MVCTGQGLLGGVTALVLHWTIVTCTGQGGGVTAWVYSGP